MNVKPGDFARVVGSEHGNEGRTCYVEGPGEFQEWEGRMVWGWAAVLLQPAFVHDDCRFVRYEAGARVWAADHKLRRIDPPGDAEELFAAPPRKEAQNA